MFSSLADHFGAALVKTLMVSLTLDTRHYLHHDENPSVTFNEDHVCNHLAGAKSKWPTSFSDLVLNGALAGSGISTGIQAKHFGKLRLGDRYSRSGVLRTHSVDRLLCTAEIMEV
jgi:hypothetical protein